MALSRSILAALLLGLLSCSQESTDAPTLFFSAIPDQDETRLREKFVPVADYLGRTLNVKVEYVHASEYSDAIDLFKNGDVHLAWFGGLSGVQARAQVPGARAIAQGEEDPQYYSYFIAHRDSGLERSDSFPLSLKGHTFTFGSSGSTSGRLMPEHFIRKHSGQSPEEFFGAENHYSGSHDKTVELVEAGQFDAGAVSYTTYDRRVAEGQTDPEVCRIIWRSDTFADYNFTAHPELEQLFGAGFTDRLQQALINMKDQNLLSAFPRKSLIAASDSDFKDIEELAKQLGFLR